MNPINVWHSMIESPHPGEELVMQLKALYRDNRPFLAEIIMNSSCPNRCLHCIYSPDYDLYNKNMTWEEWVRAFHIIHDKLGIERFIFDGRALTAECIRAIRLIKKDFPNVKMGLIVDGISMEPFIEDLIDCAPDWLDVSVDGLEKDHDTQRNRTGAYRKTMNALIHLKESSAFDKINILTCLTNVNIESVTGMIRHLNAQGFKNFFVTPVSVMKGYRPEPALQPRKEDFIRWLEDLLETAKELTDSWVEADIYDTLYMAAIKELRPKLFNEFTMNYDHLKTVRILGRNEVYIRYYPYSLTGIRELIVNSDGNVIPTNVMAMGKIPNQLVFGNISGDKEYSSIFTSFSEKEAFSYYVKEFLWEKSLIA